MPKVAIVYGKNVRDLAYDERNTIVQSITDWWEVTDEEHKALSLLCNKKTTYETQWTLLYRVAESMRPATIKEALELANKEAIKQKERLKEEEKKRMEREAKQKERNKKKELKRFEDLKRAAEEYNKLMAEGKNV